MRWTLMSASVAMLAALGACSSHTDSTAPVASQATTVHVQDNVYSPVATNVAVGTTVHWNWEGGNLHSVSFDDGQQSTVQTRGGFDRMFSQPGTYKYHCVIHGLAMSGTVVVQ